MFRPCACIIFEGQRVTQAARSGKHVSSRRVSHASNTCIPPCCVPYFFSCEHRHAYIRGRKALVVATQQGFSRKNSRGLTGCCCTCAKPLLGARSPVLITGRGGERQGGNASWLSRRLRGSAWSKDWRGTLYVHQPSLGGVGWVTELQLTN